LNAFTMLLEAIRQRLGELRPAEANAAKFILNQPAQAVKMSIQAVASTAGISEPTVLRFARRMGFDGWGAFKIALAKDLAVASPAEPKTLRQGDSVAGLAEQILARSINVLLDLRNTLSPAVLERAIHILAAARRIEVYGQGTSGYVAHDAQHKFFRCGINTVAYNDPSVHQIAAALLTAQDAVLVISQRGQTQALLRSISLAHSQGAKVVVIAPTGSTLAQHADVLLPVDQPADPNPYTPLSARLAHLTIIDMLAVGVALKAGAAAKKKIVQAQEVLRSMNVPFDPLLKPSRK
jgi:RpiR family transcriptional regulator, carbohydrate utilization regulator